MRQTDSPRRRDFLKLLTLTAVFPAFLSLSCASRSLDGRGARIDEDTKKKTPCHVVALISTNAEPYAAFDIADEAIEKG